MALNNIKLYINESSYFYFDEPEGFLPTIYFKDDHHDVNLGCYENYGIYRTFTDSYIVTKVREGNHTTNLDLGIELNKHSARKSIFQEQINYYFVGTVQNNCFLYNDKDKNIILEIAPVFQPTKRYKDNYLNRKYFKKWLSKYKPLAKLTITHETLDNWKTIMENL